MAHKRSQPYGAFRKEVNAGTVLITGCSGLIGTALSARLSRRYHVLGCDVKEPSRDFDNFTYKKMDLTSEAGIRTALAGHRGKFLSVIHLAAYYDFSGEPSSMYERLTVQGTRSLMRVLKDFPVEQFIFTSTLLVHAPSPPGQQITEASPLEPKWDYPQSKMKTEKLLRAEHGATPLLILRIAGVYDDYCHSIPISNQIQRVFENRLTSHVYPGNLDYGQPFIHLNDLTDAVEAAFERRHHLGEDTVLNLGEERTYSYQQVQDRLGQLIHGEDHWETMRILKSVARTGAWLQDKIPGIEDPFIKPWMIDLTDDHMELDISAAARALGWHPRRDLLETLPRMIDALKKDPATWYKRHHLTRSEKMPAESFR